MFHRKEHYEYYLLQIIQLYRILKWFRKDKLLFLYNDLSYIVTNICSSKIVSDVGEFLNYPFKVIL